VSISLAEDVKTVQDLEAAPRALVEQAQRTGRPIVIAEAGKPAVVLLTAERYEWLIHLRNLARLLNEAEADIRAGRTRPAEEVFEELLGGNDKVSR
jgi:prevent-host-death family protein